MSNLPLKILSLTIAVVLSLLVKYFFVDSEKENSVLQFIVPVEVKNLPPDKMIIWPPTRQAEVTIQGPSLYVSRIAVSPPSFKVPIPADVKNRFTAQLKREDLNLNPAVQVLGIKPPEIEFTLDQRISRSLSVIVPRIGSLPEHLKLDGITIEPDKVEVRGPATEVNGLQGLETVPLDLREINGPTERDLEIRVPGALSELSQRSVRATFHLSALMSEERLRDVSIEVRSTSSQPFVLKPAEVDIRLSGPQELMRNLRREQVLPFVRIPPEAAEGDQVRVEAELPAGTTLIAVTPEKVRLARQPQANEKATAAVTPSKSSKEKR